MKEKELETKSAGYYAYAASRDAAMKSFAASTFYTEAEKVIAKRVQIKPKGAHSIEPKISDTAVDAPRKKR